MTTELGPRPSSSRTSIAAALGNCAIVLTMAFNSPACRSEARAQAVDQTQTTPKVQLRVSFKSDVRKTPLDGRLLVMFSTNPKDEPRFQIDAGLKSQQIFGLDVNDLRPDQEVT